MKKVYLFSTLIIAVLFLSTAVAQNNPFSTAPKYHTVLAPPAPEAIVEVHYDGENFDAIGLTGGGSFEVAARFLPAQLGILTGGTLVQVKIYINDLPNPATLKIYGNGTATAPGPLLHSQPLTGLTALAWNTITLTSPVTITGLDMWVGYEVTHAASQFPAGCDAGPANPNGDWIYTSGSWAHLAGFGLNYNWNIRALIEEPNTGGPGAPINPSPANGATNVSNTLATISWTNPAGTTGNEVTFNGTIIHTGAAVTSLPVPGPLSYLTNYTWRVRTIDGTGTTNGPLWSFTTMQNPSMAICDNFAVFGWAPIGPLGQGNWSSNNSANALGTAPELRFNWSPEFVGESKIVSPDIINAPAGSPIELSFKHYVDWFSTTFTLGVGYSTNGGTTVTTLWTISPTGNVGPELIQVPAFNSPGVFKFVIWFSGDSFEIDYWYIDDFCAGIVPVELSSFTAAALNGAVNLNWSTATETNNKGFEVQRKVAGGDFASVAFVEGHGTTTQIQNYTYTDNSLNNGSYSYRLKQVDFNGAFEYSDAVEVDVNTPLVFALDQNYPNPFNPSTVINFSLPVDSKVSLKVFDVLGQEVANLINSNIAAGSHNVSFDASGLNSGIYFYQLEASGIDGTNFSAVKKMMLTK